MDPHCVHRPEADPAMSRALKQARAIAALIVWGRSHRSALGASAERSVAGEWKRSQIVTVRRPETMIDQRFCRDVRPSSAAAELWARMCQPHGAPGPKADALLVMLMRKPTRPTARRQWLACGTAPCAQRVGLLDLGQACVERSSNYRPNLFRWTTALRANTRGGPTGLLRQRLDICDLPRHSAKVSRPPLNAKASVADVRS